MFLCGGFKEKIQPRLRGFSGLVVYADDFVVCFQHRSEAKIFYEHLKKRMAFFGLEMEEEFLSMSKARRCEIEDIAVRCNYLKKLEKAKTILPSDNFFVEDEDDIGYCVPWL